MGLGQHSNTAIQLKPHLIGCGYHEAQLVSDVEVDSQLRIPLVAFAHPPHDSRSACVTVLDNVIEPEVEVAACRVVGSPVVFASFNSEWQLWKQGTEKPWFMESIAQSELDSFFRKNATELAPSSVYRAKTWARFDRSFQLDFVDVGLMSLIEEEAGQKLAELIERVVTDAKSSLGWLEISDEQGHWLLKSTFWLLAGKILRDKKVPAFVGLDLEATQDVFSRVAAHYGAITPVSFGGALQSDVLQESARKISRFSNLSMVTTEALSYLYENALITKETRTELGTHSTPAYLVEYIIGKLRPWIEEIPIDKRQIFEPACGHAAFLLAAMRLLSDLLPESTSLRDKHNYLRTRLHGNDVDSFALEIARLRLTLADVPNPNGWDLQPANMFDSNLLSHTAAKVNIILANPPFSDAAQMLNEIVPNMHAGAVFGVVLPQGLLHSQATATLRQTIATNFEIGEICLFPDKVFAFSDAESVVLLARRNASRERNPKTITYRHVREREFEDFKKSYRATTECELSPFRFSAENDWDFFIPDLEEVWQFCNTLPKFGEIAVIGKGFDFRSRKDPKFPPDTITISSEKLEGLVSGFVKLHRNLQTHELPATVWLNLDPAVIKTRRLGTECGTPQLLLNYARVSRGPWRLKALIDEEGHPVSSRFLVVRPRSDQWPLEALWGICNSPFANAYSYAFSSKRDVLAGLMRKMPVPDIGSKQLTPLVNAVRVYRAAALQQQPSRDSSTNLKLLHRQVDAEVLRLYDLPAKLERDLLNLFSGFQRRGVPFIQTEFFPSEFIEPLRLHELIAITGDWDQTNTRRVNLIRKKIKGTVTSIEQSELDDLQRLADARIRLLTPLPITQMEKIKEDLQRKGIWDGADATA